jgi:hypothetical protein
MPSSPQPAPAPPRRIRFPRTSSRLQLPDVYVKLIEGIIPQPFGMCMFDGRIFRPGAVVDLEALPRPAVVIECAGPIGVHQRGKHRDYQYILWSFDFSVCEWREIARSQAKDASWTAGVREAAWLALHPRPELVDIIERSRDVSNELIEAIDKRLRAEMPEVKANALYSIYERVAGRIADCA